MSASQPNEPVLQPDAATVPSRLALFRPPPHNPEEAACSLFLDTRALLIFRLGALGLLFGHSVFFALARSLPHDVYPTWNFLLTTVAFLLVVICSLLDVIREDDESPNTSNLPMSSVSNPTTDLHSHPLTDLEKQPVYSTSTDSAPTPGPVARVLTRFTVPLYQVALSASLLGAPSYWLLTSSDASYSRLFQTIAGPLLLLLDLLVSLRMHFRRRYLLLLIIYNVSFLLVVIIRRVAIDISVITFFNGENSLSTGAVIGRIAGYLFAGIIIAAIVYAIPNIPRWLTRSKPKDTNLELVDDMTSTDEKDVRDVTSESEDSEHTRQRDGETNSTGDEERTSTGDRETNSTEQSSVSTSSTMNSDERIERRDVRGDRAVDSMMEMDTGLASRTSRRSSSVCSSRRGRESNASRERRSSWTALQPPAAKVEDAFFKMPANSDGESEVVQLPSFNRSDSARSSGSGIAAMGALRRVRLPRQSVGRVETCGNVGASSSVGVVAGTKREDESG